LNQKKDYTPIQVQQPMRNENSQSPPTLYMKTEGAPDLCFSLLEKKDRPLPSALNTISSASSSSMTLSNKLVATYQSDSDEDQAANKSVAAASTFNDNDFIDYNKLTCLLCKRAFPSADVLNKHKNMSNLHKENLQKYKMQNGILDITSNSNAAALK
jgi:hypothetical protein